LAGVEGDNIAAVSGLAEWTGTDLLNKDYAVTTDWNRVAEQLESLAGTLNCSVPVKVHKTEVPVTGTPRNGADWTFTATKGQGTGTLSGTADQKTGADGKVEGWAVRISTPDGSQALTLTETARPGWTMTDFSC